MTKYDDAITKTSLLLKEQNVCFHSRTEVNENVTRESLEKLAMNLDVF